MTPLRWTVIATQVPPGGSLGGVVRYTTELIRALAQREDVIVSALTTRAAADTVADLVGSSARVSTVPNAPVPLLSVVERHAPLTGLRRDPDVVHGIKHLVPARSTALRVLTVHDMLLLDRGADFGRAKRLLLPPAYRASIRDADLLLCVSEATRQRLKAQVPGAEQRAAVVHLATSESLRAATARPIAALAGRRFALVVGDSSSRKNLRTVIAAWCKIHEQLPEVALAIAGPPNWGATDVGEAYEQLVTAGAVVPLGHVADAELRWAYEYADVVLCPSLAEGFGLPAAEALDFGAPVIVSDDAALQEVAAGRALAVLPPLAVDRWVASTVAAFGAVRRVQRPHTSWTWNARTWNDVAEDSVSAVNQAVQSRRMSASGS